jgi:hypothetical protein
LLNFWLLVGRRGIHEPRYQLGHVDEGVDTFKRAGGAKALSNL